MRILISNDDGIDADGILALAQALAGQHEVSICAPMQQQSGMSHALSVHRPLEVIRRRDLESQYGVRAWSIDGTPTDCVKIYLEAIAGADRPDIVVSGINHGANLATDVLYSGTVGAAMEGRLHDISSLAVSLERTSEIPLEHVADITADYIERMMGAERGVFLHNLNFPKRLRRGRPEFVYTKLGKRDYINAFTQTVEADGRTYFKVAGEIYDIDRSEATDIYAVESGYIAVTPLQMELTDFVALEDKLGQ